MPFGNPTATVNPSRGPSAPGEAAGHGRGACRSGRLGRRHHVGTPARVHVHSADVRRSLTSHGSVPSVARARALQRHARENGDAHALGMARRREPALHRPLPAGGLHRRLRSAAPRRHEARAEDPRPPAGAIVAPAGVQVAPHRHLGDPEVERQHQQDGRFDGAAHFGISPGSMLAPQSSAVCFIFVKICAEISCGVYKRSPMRTRGVSLLPCSTE